MGKRKYGMPYQGSKSAIAENIIEALPAATHLYDVMGGGGAITHCAALSGKWNTVHYNEIDSVIVKGFKMALNGEFANEDRFITREDFFHLKDTDPYARICFSFGNDCRSYCYSKRIEEYKKAMHEAIVKSNYLPYENMTGLSLKEMYGKTTHEKRLLMRRIAKDLHKKQHSKNIPDMQENIVTAHHISALERMVSLKLHNSPKKPAKLRSLQSLQSLQSLERLEQFGEIEVDISQGDYRDLQIPSDSVIYCDIPYKNTKKYFIEFDYEAFWEWVHRQTAQVYVSSYKLDRPDVQLVDSFMKQRNMSAKASTVGTENLYKVIKI